MAGANTPPSVKLSAFACPHCGAYSKQQWYRVLANPLYGQLPTLKRSEFGSIRSDGSTSAPAISLSNLNVSQCDHCNMFAVWVYDKLVFPAVRTSEVPNQDLPQDIAEDFEEARTILNDSPRGAAALLRLAVQKLCAHLGEKGKKIDEDIASLVSKGLSPMIQQALDVVRVIGNEAVHPGTLDLRDDRETALQLLSLVNLIAEKMISDPKKIQAMYDKLPENKRSEIDRRNQRTLGSSKE
jgi:hypothetical protein